jgi:V8-like Glu-specific endopeptidase
MRSTSKSLLAAIGAAAALAWLPAAQADDGQIILPEIPKYQARVDIDSGYVANDGDQEAVVFSAMIQEPDAAWLRLRFDEVELTGDEAAGTASYLRMTSALDGAVQTLGPTTLAQWSNTSAYFNGEAVYLELVAFPGTGANRIVMSEITAGEYLIEPRSICGPTDDRELSYADRDGRVWSVGCTAWIIDDAKHCFLMAGHCVRSDNVVQFNVPLSTPGGTPQHPGPEDQYAIDDSSIQSTDGGIGNDWAYFGCFPNSQTGLTAYQAQGDYYVLADAPPVSGQTIRITGYGSTSSPVDPQWYLVQKTHTGPYFALVGTNVQYQVDTTGGNSGSGVFNETDGVAIGIHTHAGCGTNSGNNGTAIQHAGLQNALANPQGVCAPNMDFSYPGGHPALIHPDGTTTIQVLLEGDGDDAPVDGTERFFVDTGSGFQELTMADLGGGLYEATFPASDCFTEVGYYFQVSSVGGTVFTDPGNAPASTFDSFTATDAVVGISDNFQTDMGWTAENLGADTGDWQRGVPVNDPGWDYDPTSDSDGSGQCYLTQNQTGNTDVDDGAVRLTSPVFAMSAGGTIAYDYYLYLTDTDGNDRLLVEATNNGSNWSEVARHDTSGSTSWRSHVITESDLLDAGITPGATMQVRFTANDADTQSIVEAGIDAFQVIEYICDDECPGDFDGDGDVDQADLGHLLAHYGIDDGGDIDGDGDTDQADLGALLAQYGQPC